MSKTIKFQCHIQISSKELNKVVGKTLSFMGNSKTIDENGEVIFDCELQERDKPKSFPITIDNEEYIVVGTGKCNAIAHRESTNAFCLMLNKDDEASIRDIRIYKEQDKVDSDEKEQIDIYTAQVEKREDTATQQSSTDDTHTSQTSSQENQNLIHLESHLTSGKALKKDIHWAYYVKYRNEPLWEKSKIKRENLETLLFTQKAEHNTQVSFDINAKFKYTIKENETQKEVEDYLKEKQQLIIFAYKNNPAYQTSNGQTHTILNISQCPILKLTSKTLTISYTHTNTTYTLKHSCDTHYLSENLKSEISYTLELRESSLYIKDKESSKDIAFILTKEIPQLQEKQILLDSKELQALQTILELHTHKKARAVYVEVEKPYYIDSEGYLQGLGIIKAPRPKLTEKTNRFQADPIAIVLHRTQSPTAASTLEAWKESPYGTHFLINTDGTIYQCASLHKYTQHVGDIKVKNLDINDKNYKNKTYTQASNIEKTKSYPNRYPINSDSIGIEVVGRFLGNDKKLSKYDKVFKYTQLSGQWEEVTAAQKNSVKALIQALQDIFNLNDNDIYKHGAISGHKQASEGDGIL